MRGRFIVKSGDLTLQDCIGEGSSSIFPLLYYWAHNFAGEFGIVYKAKLRSSSRAVAVKTLKGSTEL